MSQLPSQEPFNPNEFTEKELVKLIYRDLMKLRLDFDEFVKNNTYHKEINDLEKRVYNLESDLKAEKAIREEGAKKNKVLISWLSFILVAIQFLINYIFKQLL